MYLNFLCYIYLNLWIKAKDLQRVLPRKLLHALNLRSAQDVDEAPVSERSKQNTKFSASEDRDRDRKKMATNAFFQRINWRSTQVTNPQQLWNVTRHLLPEFSILGERVFLLKGLILLLGSQSRLSVLVTNYTGVASRVRVQETFSVKNQIINILGLVGFRVLLHILFLEIFKNTKLVVFCFVLFFLSKKWPLPPSDL